MASRSLRGDTVATGPDRRMQPARASAVRAAIMENRNARTTRTGVIPHNETAPVLHRLWLINGFDRRHGRACPGHPRLLLPLCSKDVDAPHKAGHDEVWVLHALTPAPIGQDTPVPPRPQ